MGQIGDGKGSILWEGPDPEVGAEMIASPELIPTFAQPEPKTIFRTSSVQSVQNTEIKEGT